MNDRVYIYFVKSVLIVIPDIVLICLPDFS